ncbi:MAG TPA: hypothetical protein EYP62_00530 [Kiritimatiellae bacterium]|nr:hypothetical protein [Kiritimatiellia bacterium]
MSESAQNATLLSELRAVRARQNMLWNLVLRDLKGRYKGSLLGFLWSILTPLFMALIYLFFLRVVAGRGVPMEEIIIGVFAWQFTVQSVNGGMGSVSSSASLIKKVYFPRSLLPLAVTLGALVNYLLCLAVQFPLVASLSQGLTFASPRLAFLPLVVLLHTGFNLALALILSSANVYFRDTPHLVGLLLSAWFFVTPVMYNLEFLRRFSTSLPWLMKFYMLNPLAVIITAYRWCILRASTFPVSSWSAAGGLLIILLLVFGFVIFVRAQRHFADYL